MPFLLIPRRMRIDGSPELLRNALHPCKSISIYPIFRTTSQPAQATGPCSEAGRAASSSSLGGGGPTGWTIWRMSWARVLAMGSFWASDM